MRIELARPPRILIADDTQKNVQVIGTVLRREGYQINVASSGEQAIELANKITPDLVLLDIMMPGGDGIETCQKLKKMKELEKAREMLRANYVQAYDAIENEFNVFSNQKMLDVYADMFSESLGEEARAAIWERATEKFYSRAEYSSADGERARRQREAHGTFAPEVSAKKEFAADDPKRFKRLVELVRDKMENGAPPKEGEQKGEKDVEVTMRAETKKAARSAALTAFVFEVLQTLQEEGSSYFAEKAPDFDHV